MDFRIILLWMFAVIAQSYAQQCVLKYDPECCKYNIFCKDFLNIDRRWDNFQHNIYGQSPDQPINTEECSKTINYMGYHIDRIFLTYKVTQSEQSLLPTIVPESSPWNRRRDDGVLDVIYSLDLSDNNYQITPVLKTMQNLVTVNLSRNQISTASLSNSNALQALTEIDLSFNRISNITVSSYQTPYTKIKTLNMSHNYLVKIPDAVFDKIDDLQTLDLSHNYIEGFSPFTFEGTRSLVHLNLSHNRLTDINSSLFRFSELKTLSLSGNRIKEVKITDFEKLNNLEYLDLSSNSIKTINYNVFHNMVLLQKLDLSNNVLENLNKDAFENLQSLTSIDLSRNKLRQLPKDLFKNRSIYNFSVSDNFIEGSLTKGTFEGVNVSTLDLSFQELATVEDYAFNQMVRLETLALNNNGIYLLSNMCFRTLTNLLSLDLSFNKISSIDFDKTDLIRLDSLFLRNNRLVQIKHENFQHLTSLQFLDLSGNSISQLEANSFKSLRSLINLKISANPFTGTLKTGTFDGLVSLPSLDISRNLLTTIQNASFNDMTELKNLNMSRSKIKELQFNVFVNTGYVETLDLSFNELDNFCVNLTELVGLSILLLNNNLIKTISSTSLHGLSRLTEINLAYNSMENIQNDSFKSLIDLRNLDLSYNEKLKFTEDLINNTENLNTLNLSGIKTNINFTRSKDSNIQVVFISDAGLSNITKLNLSTLTHLDRLSLRNNSVTRLEIGALSGINKLTYLDLSYNKLSYIQPGAFKDNEVLFHLNISHNCLSVVGYGIFRGLIYLNTLDMSFNSIKELQSERFYEVKSLTQLIVDHNKIESINVEEFAGTSLSKLSIGENPLPCRLLVRLKKRGVPFEITAIKLDEHTGENIDGVTCNKEVERSIFEPTVKFDNSSEKNEILIDMRNILYNISNKSVPQNDNSKYFDNITSVIEKSNKINNENLSKLANLTFKVIELDTDTNILLKKILHSLQDNVEKNIVAPTTTAPILHVNSSIEFIPYIDNVKKLLEKTIADEKQNILNEMERKLSLVTHSTESIGITASPGTEKLVSNNEGTNSIFTETCVALILIILVCFILYKFYKSRMFVRSRMSYSTRELPGAMDNSTL
ncbi:protein artichoke-like [Spodoptera litura]|uniref:Protein artichoke-like n=1 Tax=Spodoptera litura TaxID=69820 RepID=A0A9J7E6S7_SPOLT|nr:protein artichoke-like [Spodoptera litura]